AVLCFQVALDLFGIDSLRCSLQKKVDRFPQNPPRRPEDQRADGDGDQWIKESQPRRSDQYRAGDDADRGDRVAEQVNDSAPNADVVVAVALEPEGEHSVE